MDRTVDDIIAIETDETTEIINKIAAPELLTREATVAPASSSTNPKLTRRDIAGSS
jgi:hypothetical protein